MRTAVAIVLLSAGLLTELLAVLGLCVMRDVFDRLHCVSLASYGPLLIGAAIVAHQSLSLVGDKALLTGALIVFLSPVVVHTTARSMRVRRWGDWRPQPGELDEGRS